MPDSDKQEGISMKMLMLQVRKKPAKKLFDAENNDTQPQALKETELKKKAVRKKEKAVKG